MNAFIFSFLQVFFVLLFLHALFGKLAAPRRFIDIIKNYRLLPAAFARPAAACIIMAEAATLAALITAPAFGALAVGALLSLYTGAMAANFVRGRFDFDCGCRWVSAPSTRPKTFWLLSRNGFLMVSAMAFHALKATPLPALATLSTPPALAVAPFILPAMAAAFFFALYLFADEWLGVLTLTKNTTPNNKGFAHG